MFEELIIKKKQYTYNPLEIVKNQGDECLEIGYLLNGELKISTITNGDREELISIIKPGDCFGDLLLFQDDNHYLGDVVVIKKATIIFITKSELLQYLCEKQINLEQFLKTLTQKAYAIKQQNKLFAHKNIRDRILYDLKTKNAFNGYSFKSIASWARELSIPRETLSREITKLIKEEIITKNNHIIYLKNRKF